MDRPPGTFLLPFEILVKIIVFAADSGGQNVAFCLNLVASSFHNISMKRLYHTIQVDSEAELEVMFTQSGLSRRWVASSVRVLILLGSHEVQYENFMAQVLSTFTSLVSLGLPWGSSISPACSLPHLRRLCLSGSSVAPLHLAHNLTHLHVVSYTAFFQILQAKEEFRQLTHLLLMLVNIFLLSRLRGDLRNGLPQSLRCLVIDIGPLIMPHPDKAGELALLQDIIETDDRIVLWTAKAVLPRWKRLRVLLFNEGYSYSHFLGALNDGEIGFWELIERHI
ncbi:hypothetical protein DL96DRAFT_1818049 [Flagelloscypha sp. PMI_526]|nr:hypothetical protein DL96DRAFT_1818049 [Flagelloscypha sp. PMI_526]